MIYILHAHNRTADSKLKRCLYTNKFIALRAAKRHAKKWDTAMTVSWDERVDIDWNNWNYITRTEQVNP